jgi:hypothetical protein
MAMMSSQTPKQQYEDIQRIEQARSWEEIEPAIDFARYQLG